MKKKDFYDFLDDPERGPKGSGERELADLYRKIEGLDADDPGQDYWRQFNHRLQQRIDRLPARRAFQRWWVLPSWLAAAAAMALVAFFFSPGKTTPGLEGLNNEALLLAGQLYEVEMDVEAPVPELAEGEFEVLLQAFEPLFEADALTEEDFVPINPEKFKELWNLEG